VALPAAGYYKLTATVTAQMACSSGTFVVGAKMRNDTDNADIGVVRNVGYVDSSVALLMPGATWVRFVTVAAPKTIKLYVERVFNGTVTTSLLNGATEDTTLTFERLS
jgi:hypothetical protein